jgi:hypothetical protein
VIDSHRGGNSFVDIQQRNLLHCNCAVVRQIARFISIMHKMVTSVSAEPSVLGAWVSLEKQPIKSMPGVGGSTVTLVRVNGVGAGRGSVRKSD